MTCNREKIAITILCALLTVFLGCAVRMRTVDILPRSLSEFRYYQQNGALGVGVEPLFESSRIKEYFGVDILAEGLLPVLVMFENTSPDSSFLLGDKSFVIAPFGHVDATQIAALTEELRANSDAVREFGARYQSRALLVASRLQTPDEKPADVPFGVLYVTWGSALIYQELNAKIKSEVVNYNIKKKALIEGTLRPHTSRSGFIYVNLPKDQAMGTTFLASIKAIRVPSGGPIMFTFLMQEPGGAK